MIAAMGAAALVASGCSTHGAPSSRVQRAQVSLARELSARRAWRDVVVTVDRLHADGGRTPETLTLRGVAYRELGLLDEAATDLRMAISLREDHAPAQAALAVLLDLRGEHAAAEPHHRRAISLAPEDAGVLNDWGFSLFLRGKNDEALEVLRRAAEKAPLDRRIRNNLGFAYGKAGDFTRAAQQFDLASPPAEAKNNLGFAYEAAGNLAQAYEAYLAATRLDPTLRRARANLEHVARLLNRTVPDEPGAAGPGRTP